MLRSRDHSHTTHALLCAVSSPPHPHPLPHTRPIHAPVTVTVPPPSLSPCTHLHPYCSSHPISSSNPTYWPVSACIPPTPNPTSSPPCYQTYRLRFLQCHPTQLPLTLASQEPASCPCPLRGCSRSSFTQQGGGGVTRVDSGRRGHQHLCSEGSGCWNAGGGE